MKLMNKMVLTYLIIINIIAFIICFMDKHRAKKHKYRIPEKVLLFVSLIGGCFGFYLGMILFNHKTKKIKFYIAVPIISATWILLIITYIK